MADRAFTPIEGGKLQQPRRERVITYSDGAKHVSTSLLFRHDTLAAVAGRLCVVIIRRSTASRLSSLQA